MHFINSWFTHKLKVQINSLVRLCIFFLDAVFPKSPSVYKLPKIM